MPVARGRQPEATSNKRAKHPHRAASSFSDEATRKKPKRAYLSHIGNRAWPETGQKSDVEWLKSNMLAVDNAKIVRGSP